MSWESAVRMDVTRVVEELCSGARSPADAAEWAASLMCEIETKESLQELHFADLTVWETLATLSGSDMLDEDDKPLYGTEDFCGWLSRLNSTTM